jgi:hypothetical protein
LIGAFSAAFAVNALVVVDAEEPKKGIFTCNDAYKKLFGSCDAKPIAPYEYYYPKPEQVETSIASTSLADKPKSDVLYIGGYEITTKGVNMVFVDGDGAPFYPSSYRVTKIRDCAASVLINGIGHELVCMPNELAFTAATETAKLK